MATSLDGSRATVPLTWSPAGESGSEPVVVKVPDDSADSLVLFQPETAVASSDKCGWSDMALRAKPGECLPWGPAGGRVSQGKYSLGLAGPSRGCGVLITAAILKSLSNHPILVK